MVSIARTDAARLKTNLKRNSTRRVRKYMKPAKDASGIESVPELSLHPLSQRPQKDVIVHEGDVLENNYQQVGRYNLADETTLSKLLDSAHFNPETFFYQL
jgi:hypothetical protein